MQFDEHNQDVLNRRENLARVGTRLESELQVNWPDPVTFGIMGPGFGDVWKTLQYTCFVRRAHRVTVRLYPKWHGWPDIDYSAVTPLADRTALVREILDFIDLPPVEVVTDPPLGEVQVLLEQRSWHFPQLPVRIRWRGWNPGPVKRIAYQFDGKWASERKNPPPADLPKLLSFAPRHELIRLGNPLSVRECAEIAAGCDLFIGVDSGMMQLCYAVGVPVLMAVYRQDEASLLPFHGDRHAVRATDTADLIYKARLLLGLPPGEAGSKADR